MAEVLFVELHFMSEGHTVLKPQQFEKLVELELIVNLIFIKKLCLEETTV